MYISEMRVYTCTGSLKALYETDFHLDLQMIGKLGEIYKAKRYDLSSNYYVVNRFYFFNTITV